MQHLGEKIDFHAYIEGPEFRPRQTERENSNLVKEPGY